MKIYKATVTQLGFNKVTNLIICANSWNEAWDLLNCEGCRSADSWNLHLVENLTTDLTEATIIVEF